MKKAKRPPVITQNHRATTLPYVKLSTDGACVGNPGPGGWAYLMRFEDHEREVFGSCPHTTNNRMELAAAIEGLRALSERHLVTVSTDSQYLQRGATLWLPNWIARDWKTSGTWSESRAVVNRDLWEELDQLKKEHDVDWVWVRGHDKDPDNLRCDVLANKAALEQSATESRTFRLGLAG